MATYVFSDLHGRKDLWLKANKEVFGPNDIIYFLGDAADRGPDGWEMIKILLDDERVNYIKGNHDEMLYQAIVHHDTQPLFWNGGENTYEHYNLDTEDNQFHYLFDLHYSPDFAIYKNDKGQTIFLTHAGFTPYEKIRVKEISYDDKIWDRNHIYDMWFPDEDNENFIAVHGHTPVQNVNAGKEEIYTYCEGHKIDIDLGAFVSNKLGVLNLDTFEEIIISID